MFARFIKSTDGSSAAEYVLTLGVLGFAVVLGNIAIQQSVESSMNREASAIAGPSSPDGGSGSGSGGSGGNGGSGGSGSGGSAGDGSGQDGTGSDGSGGSGNGNGNDNCKPKKNC